MTLRAGVAGSPAKHSLSPIIHGAWLTAAEIDGTYEIFDLPADGFADFIRWARTTLSGLNVTVPFKEQALAIADQASDRARLAGAANVLVFEDGKIFADNTDGIGLLHALRLSGPFDPSAGSIMVFGSGGAAQGAVAALISEGATDIRIVNRTFERGQELASRFPGKAIAYPRTEDQTAEALKGVQALIQSTLMGMDGQPALDIDLSPLPVTALVMDMVYVPLETPLLKEAKRRGHRVSNGLDMLIGQAIPSFEMFFGATPPDDVDVKALCLGELERRL